MNGVKVTYGNLTKRISEQVKDYDTLVMLVTKIFSLTNDSSFAVRLCYLDKENEKIEVSSNDDLEGVKLYHKENNPSAVMKMEVLQINLKDSLNVEDMLNNVNLSESFAVVDHRDAFYTLDKNKIMKEISPVSETNSELKNSSLVKSVEVNTNSVQKEEKSIQSLPYEKDFNQESKSTETEKIQTFESESNTNSVTNKEEATQMENRTLKDNSMHTEKVQVKEECVQANNEDDWDECERSSIRKNSKVSQVMDSFVTTDQIIIDKIDSILSSKIKQMEANLIQKMENQSKVYSDNYQIDSNCLNLITEPKVKPENQMQKIDHNLDINKIKSEDINLIRDISVPGVDFPSMLINPEGSKYHFDDYCSKCNYQILKNKYICLLCNDFKLCSSCESSHLMHPLLKINIECPTLTTKDEVGKYLATIHKKNKKRSIFKNFKSYFKSPACFVSLSPVNDANVFAMASGQKSEIEIRLVNEGNKTIEGEINIIPINNKNFGVSVKIVEKLEVNSYKKLKLNFEAPKEVGLHEFEILATMKKQKLICEPLKFAITVTKSDEVDEANANLLLGHYEDIMKLDKNARIGIYTIISQNIFKKDINDIVNILRHYNFDLSNAWDELEKEVPCEERCYGPEF